MEPLRHSCFCSKRQVLSTIAAGPYRRAVGISAAAFSSGLLRTSTLQTSASERSKQTRWRSSSVEDGSFEESAETRFRMSKT